MSKITGYIPLFVLPSGRARSVSLFQRLTNLLFGSPNARRANGIIYSGFDIAGFLRNMVSRVFGKKPSCPVFEIDRVGTLCGERLPRIWLSEQVFNTRRDDGRRMFVECYPTSPDKGGERALELGDRYLGEGMRPDVPDDVSLECFKAAEILYLHSTRRGNRIAIRRLHEMYKCNLCSGMWHETYLESRAKHAKKRTPGLKMCA